MSTHNAAPAVDQRRLDPMDSGLTRAVLFESLSGVSFVPELVDQAVIESGLAREFELDPLVMRRLAANAQVLMSLVVCIEREEDFQSLLVHIRRPDTIPEMGFLFGFAEFIRMTLLSGLVDVDSELQLRALTKRRLESAHALCKAQVLQAMS